MLPKLRQKWPMIGLIKVEYKNFGLICFTCGRYGHSKEICKEGEADVHEEM
ncbi:hypothetical protein ACOSP7_005140 [Xanthoceras sorbifolium]